MPCCILRCVLVCVWVRIQVLNMILTRLRYKTQWWEANLRVGRSSIPNTFPRAYLNSEPISLVVRSKGPSSKGHYIYGSYTITKTRWRLPPCAYTWWGFCLMRGFSHSSTNHHVIYFLLHISSSCVIIHHHVILCYHHTIPLSSDQMHDHVVVHVHSWKSTLIKTLSSSFQIKICVILNP